MLDVLFWYLIITVLGWLAFPIIYRLLPNLPDRGLSFSKIFGLLLWGYIYWLFGRLGLLANSLAGLIFSLVLVSILTIWVLNKNSEDGIRSWLKGQIKLIITLELIFIVCFLGWALIRSLNPEIVGTEKPMELAFINAILRSETLPPNDPWLSGYAISYYYFGYILIAMLAKLAGTMGSVAFNLGVSLIFSLTALGSFGLLYNLLALSRRKSKLPIRLALLGPAFTLIISNWEGFLHFLHSRGVFWRDSGNSAFWNWLDIQDLTNLPNGDSFGHWWWWRASRVIQDYDFSGFGKEVISEFPFFSFLLADLHPHVLSMPFVFLILVFTLELFIRPREGSIIWLKLIPLKISLYQFLTLAWLAGAMAFLNTWNFPMYVGILAGAYALRNNREATTWQVGEVLRDIIYLGVALGVTGGVMYLPWYLGFASQAGGIIPNVLYITRGVQFWVMFGPLLVPIFIWVFLLWGKRKDTRQLQIGISITGIMVAGLLVLMMAIVFGVIWLPLENKDTLINLFLTSVGGSEVNQVIAEGFLRRILVPGTLLTLATISTLVISMLIYRRKTVQAAADAFLADQFILILILAGIILTLVPEFVFLRDLFGYRINTIFKFYFQAWLMWSIAAAYGTISVFRSANSPVGYILSGVLTLALILGIFYPVMGIRSKTNNFTRAEGMNLDGEYLYPPSDSEGAAFLRSASPGVIAEAVGGSYSTAHARMATYSGNPNVLGWDFHEIQWRGDGTLVWPRKEKISTLYCTHSWDIAREIIDEFKIRYVVLGDVEYSTYQEDNGSCPNGLQAEKFNRNLNQVFRNDHLIIFEVPFISIDQ
jgi:YYY domain-containing protein